nr:MAG TPA: hypothetical protein [Caudoviricetes sp.]
MFGNLTHIADISGKRRTDICERRITALSGFR